MDVSPAKAGQKRLHRRRFDAVSREVGKKLRDARLAADLSQSELAKKLRTRKGTPVAPSKISAYERGEWIPEERLRPQLAAALGVSEAVLFEPLLPGADRTTLASRLERVEQDLGLLRRQIADLVDAQAAALAAQEGDAADRASRKDIGRSRGPRTSRGGSG